MSNLTLRIDEHVTMTGHIMSYYQIGKAHFYGETVPVDWYLLYDAGDAQAVEPGDCGDCESITAPSFDAFLSFNCEDEWRSLRDEEAYPAIRVDWSLIAPGRKSIPFRHFESTIGLKIAASIFREEKYEEVESDPGWMHLAGLNRWSQHWVEGATNSGVVIGAQHAFTEFHGSEGLETDVQVRVTTDPLFKIRWVLGDPIQSARTAYTWKLQGSTWVVFRKVSWNEI